MNCQTLVQRTLPTPEVVRQWARPFDNTGIDTLHLCHIVAGQAAAFAALNVAAEFQGNPDYRPSVSQVEQWISSVKEIFSEEQLLQFVAEQGTHWVVSQVCPIS